MGDAFDPEDGLTLLDLYDLVADGAGEFSFLDLAKRSLPQALFPVLFVRSCPGTDRPFRRPDFLGQELEVYTFLEKKFCTAEFGLEPVAFTAGAPLTFGSLADFLDVLHGFTPFPEECHPFYASRLAHDLVVRTRKLLRFMGR